jgi:hypothetical protein
MEPLLHIEGTGSIKYIFTGHSIYHNAKPAGNITRVKIYCVAKICVKYKTPFLSAAIPIPVSL